MIFFVAISVTAVADVINIAACVIIGISRVSLNNTYDTQHSRNEINNLDYVEQLKASHKK